MKYYGQMFNGVPADKFLHERYFQNKQNGFFIECGAADGFNLSTCKFFEESMGWTGINVEASPAKYAELLKNRPNSFVNLNKGLLNEPGTFIFRDDPVLDPTKAPGWGNGSFQHTENHYYQLHNMGIELKEYEIVVITYKQLIEAYKVEHVDLFVLDVEGVEPMILESMVDCKVLPTHLFIEHEHIGLENCAAMTAKLGYRLDWNDFCNSMHILDNGK
jgi:FkbM family methyltransferase